MKIRVLIVEDNPDLAFGLRNNLEIEGYEVAVAEDGPSGLARALEWKPDLVILDIMLPGMDGHRVLRTLRDARFTAPVLMLTARGEESDQVRGLRSGADDYVTKPFGVLELLARVEALLRRSGQQQPVPADRPDVYRFGNVTMDAEAQMVYKAGEPVNVTHREFLLLVALLKRRGGVVSRQDLLREAWGHQGDVLTRTIDSHIVELRRKLEDDPAHPRHILTIRRMGYRIQP
jgi:DNA-binding response OmpR family regulator